MIPLLLVIACKDKDAGDTSTEPSTVPWSQGLEETSEALEEVRGYTPRRGIVHLHSPWSHDACDGLGYVDGEPNLECAADLREGLCTTRQDYAYLTDHPDYSTTQAYEDLLFLEDGDESLTSGARLHCDNGHDVVILSLIPI